MEKGDYDFSKKLNKKQHKHADNPVFSEQIKNRIKDSHFEVSALSIGMKLELDAMKYYRSCAKTAHNELARRFYNELAELVKAIFSFSAANYMNAFATERTLNIEY